MHGLHAQMFPWKASLPPSCCQKLPLNRTLAILQLASKQTSSEFDCRFVVEFRITSLANERKNKERKKKELPSGDVDLCVYKLVPLKILPSEVKYF